MQADIIIKLWPNCKPGFLFMLFVFSWTTWTVAKPEAWLPWPPPGAQQSQDSFPPPPPSYLWGFVLHSQLTVLPSHFQSGQCPGRLEARSEAHSALSLKPKQDYFKNFPNSLLDEFRSDLLEELVLWTQYSVQFSSVQSLSRVWLFATPWIAARQASQTITNCRSSLKLMSIELVMPSSHLILCRPLLLLLPIPPSIRVFSNESTLRMRWQKYWSYSFGIIPSKEHPGLISFRMDWLDLLAVQGTLKSLLQHHSSKASILPRSAFFTVQLSHPYVTRVYVPRFLVSSQ